VWGEWRAERARENGRPEARGGGARRERGGGTRRVKKRRCVVYE